MTRQQNGPTSKDTQIPLGRASERVREKTVYVYKALDRTGQSVSGDFAAHNETAAIKALADKSLQVYSIKRQPPQIAMRLRKQRITDADLARFVRQLATLLGAGVSMLEAMGSLAKSDGHAGLQQAALDIRRDLRAGQRLSETLEARLPGLPSYVARLAELGEATGQSKKALADAAERMEFEASMKAEIRTALTYPAFLLVVGSMLVMLLFIFVVPRFDTLIGDRDVDLPAFSEGVLSAGRWMSQNLLLFGFILAALVGLAIWANRSESIRRAVRTRAENIPALGPLLVQSDLGGWAKTVGIALSNGADLLTALRLGEAGIASERLASGFVNLRSRVRGGEDFEAALEESVPDFDGLTIDLIRTGRVSGQLADMLLFIGNGEEERTRTRAKRFAALAEPIAILSISAIIGAVVISIVLAMTSVYDFSI